MSNLKAAQDIHHKLEFYLVAIAFTTAAFATQTGRFTGLAIGDFTEASSWVLFVLSGVLGLMRLEYLPVAYRVHDAINVSGARAGRETEVSLVAAHWIYKRAGQSQVLQRRYNQLAQAMAEYRRALEKSQQDHGVSAISPLMVTEGSPTTTVTLKGFSFVRRSQVLFKRVPVPYKAVSGSEIGLQWGNGTSNKAHLIVRFRD